jgi:ribosomal-protein-alanine N-acetyltransferase
VNVVPLTDEYVDAVLQWQYEPPYDVYNPATNPDELQLLNDPARRSGLRAVVDREQLVGFFNFVPRGSEVHVGLALRPDLTGRGLGRDFVTCGLAYAREKWSPTSFRLWVRASNERAQRVYERSGFRTVRRSCRVSDRLEFVEMERSA